MTRIDEARQLVAERKFSKLEDLWTDLITEKEIELGAYLAITDLITEAGQTDRACLLLDILSEHYLTQRKYDWAIEVRKHMLRYRKEDAQIRKELIAIYRKKYTDSSHLEDYLQHSGMSTDQPIMKAIGKFEEYLRYDVGKHFFFERYGLGKVVATNPEKREIVVDFERKKKHFLTIDVARGLLAPVDEHHFLYQKQTNIDNLKSLASSTPDELLVRLLQSFQEPLSGAQIKGYLEGIIEKPVLHKFWEKARKRLEKHDNIRVTGKTSKIYSYVASAEDKQNQARAAFHRAGIREKYELAEEYAKKMPAVFERLLPHLVTLGNGIQQDHPGVALDILMLMQEIDRPVKLDYSTDDILRSSTPETIIGDMTNHEHQQKLLVILEERLPEKWREITSRLVLASDDSRLIDALIDRLKNAPDILDDIYHRILAMPKQYPKQFHWMLKRMAAGSLTEYVKPTLIPRLIDSLEYVRGIKTALREILTLGNFDTIIAQAHTDEAMRIRDAVGKSNVLTDYEKRNFMRIVEHHFPEFAEEKSDIIYTTESALKRKKAELNHIVTVQIPENKKEIGRAREFGDLSENFEYKAAKEKQDQLFEKAKTIESELLRTQLIEPGKVAIDHVDIGTAITLERTDNASVVTYKILGRWDTDLSNNIISNEAPLAQMMLDKEIGDSIDIEGIAHKIITITSAF